MTNGGAFRFPAVAGSYTARGAQCDGSHRKRFTKGRPYALPTTGEFNMCNCTPRTGALGEQVNQPGPAFPGGPEHSRTDPPGPARGPGRTRPDARLPAAAPGLGVRAGTKKSRWTRRSPARSNDAPVLHRYGARWGGRPSCGAMGGPVRVGGPGSPVVAARQGCVRPRCAAAEYPQAVRGPLPRGTGDVHRAYGWT